MAGVAARLTRIDTIKDLKKFRSQYDKLLDDEAYMEAVETGTSQEANVETRMRLAREAFAKVR
jgi:hypothetical protein